MKKALSSTFLLAAVAALFLAGAWYGRQTATTSAKETERKVLHYVDPMNPAHTSDQPGLAPCGMKMEPVYADDGPAEPMGSPTSPGTVKVSPDKQQLIGVKVAVAQRASPAHTIRTTGRVTVDEARAYRLVAGAEGFIREVSPAAIGDRVEKDQWLATFSAPDSRQTIQSYLATLDVLDRQRQSVPPAPAPANAAKAGVQEPSDRQIQAIDASVQLAVDRLKNLGLSGVQIEEIKRNRELATDLRIVAPTHGVVLARGVSPGLKFEKGAEWYRIADLSRVWIMADVFANDAEYFKPGALAQVSVAGQRKSVPARVSEVLPQFDPATRTLKVRLEVDNPGLLLRPEMFVDVVLPVTLPPTLAIPADAVLDTGFAATVFVDRGNGFFEPRVVETGWRLGDQVEIVKGLEPGEQIVTSGNFLLDSESRMRLAAAGMHGTPAKDFVCGMSVDQSKARAANRFSEYQGKTYYFCNPRCKRTFDEAPTGFVTGTAQPQTDFASAPAHAGLNPARPDLTKTLIIR